MTQIFATKHKLLFPFFLILFLLLSASGASAAWAPAPNEHWIRIDKEKLKLYLHQGTDKIVKTYPVAIGKGTGEKREERKQKRE